MRDKTSLHRRIWRLCAGLLLISGCSQPVKAPPEPASAQASLQNTVWRVISIDGREIDRYSIQLPVEFALSSVQTLLTGHTGCNRLLGKYTSKGTTLELRAIVATHWACQAREQEAALMNALGRTTGFAIDGDRLRLLSGIHVELEAEATPRP